MLGFKNKKKHFLSWSVWQYGENIVSSKFGLILFKINFFNSFDVKNKF
jgi:hypothetical protein